MKKELEQIKAASIVESSQSEHLRSGQIFYSKLYNRWPNIADRICGMDIDPFYVDENIDKCINWIVINY